MVKKWSWPRRAAVVFLAAVAAAALPAVASAAAPATTPDATYQTNDRVDAILAVGDTVYIGGRFTSVRPPGAPAGSGEVPRDHLAAFDISTGALLPWDPSPDAAVLALAASPDGRTLYVGGHFSHIAGQTRHRFAALSADASGAAAVVPGWGDMNMSADVQSIAATATRVYVGGHFLSVDGQSRGHLAAFDVTSSGGALDPSWKPTATDPTNNRKFQKANILSLAVDGDRIFVAGAFDTLDGFSKHRNLDALDLTTGQTSLWNYHPGFAVFQVIPTAQRLYLGGDGAGGNLQAIDMASQSVSNPNSWVMLTDGGIQAIALIGDTVYAGGHFDNVCNQISATGPPFTCTSAKAVRHKIFAVPASGGDLDSWYPGANSALGLFAMASTSDGRLEIGGDFTRTGNPNGLNQARTAQQGFAQYSPPGAGPIGGPAAITAPADGASLAPGATGPLTVSFLGAATGTYQIAVDGPDSYHWTTSYHFDGSPTSASWPFTPLPAAGTYSVSVNGPAGTTTASFTVVAPRPTLLPSSLSPATIYPYERDGYRDRVRISFGATAPASFSIAIRGRHGRLWRTIRPGQLAAGRHSVTWAGWSDAGHLVQPGRYTVTVTASAGGASRHGRALPLTLARRPARVVASQLLPARIHAGERAHFRFVVSAPARAWLQVRTHAGRLVRSIGPVRARAGHWTSIPWSGRRTSGRALAPGSYRLRVVVRAPGGGDASRSRSLRLLAAR